MSAFHGSERDRYWERGVVYVELRRGQLLGCEAEQEGGRRQDVPMTLDRQMRGLEHAVEQASCRPGGEAPVIAPALLVVRAHFGDPRDRCEEHAARGQDPSDR